MKSFVYTANPNETKRAYEMGVIDGFVTKRVLERLEEDSQEIKRRLFKRAPFNHQANKQQATGHNSKDTSFPRSPSRARRASFILLPTKSS
jgi:enoyl-CoA hydratase/carnithine racemase